jgi:hypothetical protein
MIITIQTAYSGVFFSEYDIAEYVDGYIEGTLESSVMQYFDAMAKLSNDHIEPSDRYKIDKDGNITYYDDKGGNDVDYLMNDTGEEIKINDTSILPQLKLDRNWDLNYNGIHEGNYAITDNFSEASKVFEFTSFNIKNEWVLRKFTNRTFLGTNNYSDAARGDTPGFNDLDLVLDIHSHPGDSPKDGYASGYSFEQIRRRARTGYGSSNFGDVGRSGNIYNKMIRAGKINSENGYKGAPKFRVYRPHISPPKYFNYNAWRKKF